MNNRSFLSSYNHYKFIILTTKLYCIQEENWEMNKSQNWKYLFSNNVYFQSTAVAQLPFKESRAATLPPPAGTALPSVQSRSREIEGLYITKL